MEERPVREVAGCDLDLHQVGESIAARYGQTPHARREAKLHHSLSTLNLTTKTPTGAKEDDEGSGSRSPRGGHHRIRTPAPRRETGAGEGGEGRRRDLAGAAMRGSSSVRGGDDDGGGGRDRIDGGVFPAATPMPDLRAGAIGRWGGSGERRGGAVAPRRTIDLGSAFRHGRDRERKREWGRVWSLLFCGAVALSFFRL